MVLRIFKLIATSGFVTALERTKFVFGRGSAPNPVGGAYSGPPDSLAGLKRSTSKGERGGRMEKGREGKGRRGTAPPFANSWPGSASGTHNFFQTYRLSLWRIG